MSSNYSYKDAVPIENVLYGQFIKYYQLDKMYNFEFEYKPPLVNVYIDLYQMILPLYNFYRVENPLGLASSIINMAIHYRNFFYKYNTYSNIFMIYSPTMSVNNTRYCPEYNNKHTNRIMNNKEVYDIVNNTLNIIGTIIPYLKNVYLKIGTVETSVIAYDLITKFESKGFIVPSFFVTSSQYAFQLPAANPRIYLFYKKKNKNGEDVSYTVNNMNALDCFIAETRNQHIPKTNLNQSWISGFMTLSGLPKREIKAIYSYKEAIRILDTIKDSYNVIRPDIMIDVGTRLYKKSINPIEIENRFNCIDLLQQLALYRTLPESKEKAFLTQLNDRDELLRINDIYFRDNPINLDKL